MVTQFIGVKAFMKQLMMAYDILLYISVRGMSLWQLLLGNLTGIYCDELIQVLVNNTKVILCCQLSILHECAVSGERAGSVKIQPSLFFSGKRETKT